MTDITLEEAIEVAETEANRRIELEKIIAEQQEGIDELWDDTQELTWPELADDFSFLVESTVNGPRQGDYGPPERMLSLIAHMWSPLFNVPINAQSVAVALLLMKVARMIGGQGSPDTVLDAAGYAYILAKVQAIAAQQAEQQASE